MQVLFEAVSGDPEPCVFENLSFSNETSTNSCDGYLTVGVNNYGSDSLINIVDLMGNTHFNIGYLNNNPQQLNNLCLNDTSGAYIVAINDTSVVYAIYNSLDLNSSIFHSIINFNCGSFSAFPQTSLASDTLICDGSVNTYVMGGTPPYSYLYSNGITTAQANNLCPGFYSVLVTDAVGDTTSTTFVIGTTTNYFQSAFLANVYDTLYSNAVLNCTFDYSLPIDSVYLDTFAFISGNDIEVTYIIIQGANQYAWTQTLYFDSIANYYVSISLYCENRSLDDTYTILAPLPLANMQFVGLPELAVEKINNLSVYPNPFNTSLIIDFNSVENMDINIEVFDISGRLIHQENSYSNKGKNSYPLNLNNAANGIYFININSDKLTLGTQKIIKN